MKFNEGLYELTTQIKEEDNSSIEYSKEEELEILKDKKEFLDAIIPRIKNQISEGFIGNGIMYVGFISRFYGREDEGYSAISNLVKRDAFIDLQRDYYFFIDGFREECDEYKNSFYKIGWDYESYLKDLNKPEILKQIKEYKKRKQEEECEKNGHDFDEWIYFRPSEPIGISFDPLFESDDDDMPYWQRKCKRCGFIERMEQDPQEYLLEIKETEEEIQRLSDRLQLLKSKKN